MESTADGILVVSTDGRITGSNRRFAEIWHLPEELVAEQNNATALAFALDQLTDPEASVSEEERRSFTSEYETFTILEFRDGRVVERASRPQRVDGRVVGRVMSFRDVTDRKRLEDELAYRAFHDPLTGLANKALFQDRLDHALARLERSGSHLAVLFIDLDNFKTVNDSLGHGEGDDLLKRVAGAITGCLRPADTAARLGGDEFAVLIEDVRSHDVVTDVAQRLLESLRPHVRLGSKSVSSAGSIGIAFDVTGITSEQLLRNADIAMYKAKELGKDRFEVYRDECTPRCWPASSSRTTCETPSWPRTCSRTTSPSWTCTRTGWSASRPWCGGHTRAEAWSIPASSCRWRKSWGWSGRSTRSCCAPPAGRPASGSMPAWPAPAW